MEEYLLLKAFGSKFMRLPRLEDVDSLHKFIKWGGSNEQCWAKKGNCDVHVWYWYQKTGAALILWELRINRLNVPIIGGIKKVLINHSSSITAVTLLCGQLKE